ncbi:MAG: 6,7-dimethyl-8-ribityllumazine synthase [Candidatus Omnitrophica bacterium]|nr:6,7-dimethyl-8-ribityllumazine synthase [Candidatus Omnitrophota bacterium]
MVKVVEAGLIAKEKKFALVVSRFNNFITKKLVEGAIDCLVRHGVKDSDIKVVWVPGSFEIPYVTARLLQKNKQDAIICLGAVIRGATPHFDYVASEVTKGIANLSLTAKVPLAMGIITADNLEQAIDRAGAKEGNKGYQAALSAIELVNLSEKI